MSALDYLEGAVAASQPWAEATTPQERKQGVRVFETLLPPGPLGYVVVARAPDSDEPGSAYCVLVDLLPVVGWTARRVVWQDATGSVEHSVEPLVVRPGRWHGQDLMSEEHWCPCEDTPRSVRRAVTVVVAAVADELAGSLASEIASFSGESDEHPVMTDIERLRAWEKNPTGADVPLSAAMREALGQGPAPAPPPVPTAP